MFYVHVYTWAYVLERGQFVCHLHTLKGTIHVRNHCTLPTIYKFGNAMYRVYKLEANEDWLELQEVVCPKKSKRAKFLERIG